LDKGSLLKAILRSCSAEKIDYHLSITTIEKILGGRSVDAVHSIDDLIRRCTCSGLKFPIILLVWEHIRGTFVLIW